MPLLSTANFPSICYVLNKSGYHKVTVIGRFRASERKSRLQLVFVWGSLNFGYNLESSGPACGNWSLLVRMLYDWATIALWQLGLIITLWFWYYQRTDIKEVRVVGPVNSNGLTWFNLLSKCTSRYWTVLASIAGFHSRDQQPCFSTKTKGSLCIIIKLNSRRIWSGHQHGRLFFV